MNTTFDFHYQGFSTRYSTRLSDGWWDVFYKDEYVTAFPEADMKEMIDQGRVRIVASDVMEAV